MNKSIKILTAFVLGLTVGLIIKIPELFKGNDVTIYILYGLIFLVGVNIGSEGGTWKFVKRPDFSLLAVPASVIIGTYAGVLVLHPLIPHATLRESLAVSSGFGYYSLSSVIITQSENELLGVAALISNIAREIFTLIFAPVLVKYFGKLAPIVSGGATAMDTTLPVITKFSGKEYALVAVLSGVVLTFLVPVLITLILKM